VHLGPPSTRVQAPRILRPQGPNHAKTNRRVNPQLPRLITKSQQTGVDELQSEFAIIPFSIANAIFGAGLLV
jgi:hypothetical protein